MSNDINDIIKYKKIIENQELDEKGGFLDKALSGLGDRAAAGRVAWEEIYNDMLGDWKEYATKTGLDNNLIFSKKDFPTGEFVSFLQSRFQFNDDMIADLNLTKTRGNVKDVFQNAAQVEARRQEKAPRRKKEVPDDTSTNDTTSKTKPSKDKPTVSDKNMEAALRNLGVPLDKAVEIKNVLKQAKNIKQIKALAKDKKLMPLLALVGVAYLYET